ncbi:hypothetical protein D3C81_1273520 [compost metagenome]
MPANLLVLISVYFSAKRFSNQLRAQAYAEYHLPLPDRFFNKRLLADKPWKLLLIVHPHRTAQNDEDIELRLKWEMRAFV